MRQWGRPVILSDGDAVFQPRKIARSGLWDAFAGNVLIYVHKEKELADVERWHPAAHYVLVDDKARILAAVKAIWGDRVTTIFPKQGHFALQEPPRDGTSVDLAIDRIGDLLGHDLSKLTRDLRRRPRRSFNIGCERSYLCTIERSAFIAVHFLIVRLKCGAATRLEFGA